MSRTRLFQLLGSVPAASGCTWTQAEAVAAHSMMLRAVQVLTSEVVVAQVEHVGECAAGEDLRQLACAGMQR